MTLSQDIKTSINSYVHFLFPCVTRYNVCKDAYKWSFFIKLIGNHK